jgi:hypothetical protein
MAVQSNLMRPVSVRLHISAPREALFDYVADLALRVAFSDHYLTNFHLARAKSTGRGAAASFRLQAPLARGWGELWIERLDPPRRLLEEGRIGRVGRTRLWSLYEFSAQGPGLTRIELTSWTEPGTKLDALKESFGFRRWLKRQNKVALERLRKSFEAGEQLDGARATIAGFEPHKAPRFGDSLPREGADHVSSDSSAQTLKS